MKHLFLYIVILFFELPCSSQTTLYFKLTRKIVQGVSYNSVSGGQFISFNKKDDYESICYESDKYGSVINDSKLKCQVYEDGVYTYYGKSYWGNNTYFSFNSDKSVMNVTTPSGDTYIYKRSTAPANVTTCSLIRNRTTSGGSSVTVAPSYGGNSSYTPQHNGNGSSSTSNYGPRKRVEYYADCSFCHGTGRCKTCSGNGYYPYSFGSGYINCPNCKNPGNNSRRGNGVCAHCQNGKVKKHRYE